jgi:hypothetical protein
LRALIVRFEMSDEDPDAGTAAVEAVPPESERGIVALADFRRGECENPT